MGNAFDIILPVIAVIVVILVVVGYWFFLSGRMNKGEDAGQAADKKDARRITIKNAVIVNYVDAKILAFYEALRNALPGHYIIIPNVSVELLFHVGQRPGLNLKGHYADFGIFTGSFKPAICIDLIDYSATGEAVRHLSSDVKDIVVSSGVPVLDYEIRDTYSVDDLRRAIAKTMNPLLGS